jgi:hypothetical protein
MAVNSSGVLWAWGANYDGALGNGTTQTIISPIYIGITSDWAKPVIGLYQSYVFKTDGALYASGNNQFGQLGDNSYINRLVHIPITQCANSGKLSVKYRRIANTAERVKSRKNILILFSQESPKKKYSNSD